MRVCACFVRFKGNKVDREERNAVVHACFVCMVFVYLCVACV